MELYDARPRPKPTRRGAPDVDPADRHSRRRLRPDRCQYLLCPAAGGADRRRRGPALRGDRPDRHPDADRLWRRPAACRPARRPRREPPAGARRHRHRRSGPVRCRFGVQPIAAAGGQPGDRRRVGGGADPGALCRASGAGSGSRPGGRKRHGRADARHHAGAAGGQSGGGAVELAGGVRAVGGDDGGAGHRAAQGPAAACAPRAAEAIASC